MDYFLEQLGDERFQKLCQAILINFHPDLLCLPVGQPDGGRDAFTRGGFEDEPSDQVIFQVKFVKDPQSRDSRDLIQQIIATEGPKVAQLRTRGAVKYYLLTNASGTSHLDVGSIDKVNKELSEALNIEAYCWWRDDIERRIDNNRDIKWSFPEILKATDLIEQLLLNTDDSESKRRADVLKIYMAHQARYDAQLKFKQVELQKDIIDQFVDIPVRFIASQNEDQQNTQDYISEILSEEIEEQDVNDQDFISDEDEDDIEVFGALQLMIHPEFSKSMAGVVIEGAPGQGKSTVTQYLCQVNRLVLLGRTLEIKRINKLHLPTEARIPFRIDLRDYASWLAGRDPFNEGPPSRTMVSHSPLLESFIAAQVNRYTGSSFCVDDLISISKISRLLIVLDGFDEVADIKIRNRIVSEVSDAAIRICENALSSQIIVTSRPTAFANSPGFSRNEWHHIKILPLSRRVIEQYATKWLDGRSLEQREKLEILSVLDEKLKQSHVRDLARNPMQLAILLALISVQGASLPDKRTALYDNYIDIFLNRESEKSKIVRDHRDLLIQIHRYLAWVLQSEAEEKSEAGNISESRLREVLRTYLESSGHSPQLVDELFSGMVERVVALVSRVQGTFEFEVQPLREYFAARYLYDTAPYSPAGAIRKGTLPERFEAIAKNFYWLNVTRFYAGCYSSGELSSLIDGLDELAESPKFRRVGQPSRLGILLLRDHVFNQHPKLSSRVIKKITTNLGFRVLLSDSWSSRNDHNGLMLPQGSSREALTSTCFELIENSTKFDTIYIAAKALTQNCTYEQIHDFWMQLRTAGKSRLLILQTGSALGIFDKITKPEVISLLEEHSGKYLASILRHQRLELLEDNDDDSVLIKAFVHYAKNSNNALLYFNKNALTLSPKAIAAYCLAIFGSGFFLSQLAGEIPDRTLRSLLSSGAFRAQIFAFDQYKERQSNESNEPDKNFSEILSAMDSLYNTKLGEIRVDIRPWSKLIELFRSMWGDAPTLYTLSVHIAELYKGDSPITPLCSPLPQTLISEAISIKENINSSDWLSARLSSIKDSPEPLLFILVGLLKWASTETLLKCSTELSKIFENLSEKQWQTVTNSFDFQRYIENSTLLNISESETLSLPENLSNRLTSFLTLMLNQESKLRIWHRYLQHNQSDNSFILECEISAIVENAWDKPELWQQALKSIKKGYSSNFIYNFEPSRLYSESLEIPLEIAKEICEAPNDYPIDVLSAAESVLLADIGKEIVPVGKIAYQDSWFEDTL